jgi:cytochrome c2
LPDRRILAATAALALTVSACSSPGSSPPPPAPPKPDQPIPDPALVEQGKQLVAQKGCGGCHVIPGIAGATGTLGPNLAGVANRPTIAGGAVMHNGQDDLKRWVQDPPAAKPGTAMPNLNLSEVEANSIAAFLETLR